MAALKKVGNTGNIDGIEITEDNTKEILAGLEKATQIALTMIGMKAEKYAKALCPVGTPESTGWTDKNGKRHPNKGYRGGTLRNSITFQAESTDDGGFVSIGSNVEYAPYVELGTGPQFEAPPEWEQFDAPQGSGKGKGMRPRHFLRDAIVDHKEEYVNIIKKELGG